jgi:hypothetical protein
MSTKVHFLDTSQDQWIEEDKLQKLTAENVDLSKLIKEFKQISHKTWNFISMLETALNSELVDEKVKQVLTEIIESCRDE